MARLVEVDDTPNSGARLVEVTDSGNEPFGKRLNREVANITRQVGLTVRHGVQGVADVADIVGSPLAATLNYFFPASPSPSDLITGSQPAPMFDTPGQSVTRLLDYAGLPKPNNPIERVVEAPSRMLAGSGGLIKLANTGANVANDATKATLAKLTTKPGLQAASAIGSGAAGGYVKETGGDPTSQFIASLAGGILAPTAVQGVSSGKNVVMNLLNRNQPNVTVVVENALKQSGFKMSDVPKSVLKELEGDVSKAMQTGEISPGAMDRLIAYRMVGATPARGNLTLNPVDITQQQNLSKIGANSSNPRLNALSMRQNENTGKLIEGLNALGANTADDQYSAGQRVIDSLAAKQASAKAEIDAAYSAARDASGRSVPLDPHMFTQRANDLIDKAMVGGSLPPGVRDTLNKVATGEIPLTVEVAEQIKTNIGNLQRASNDGSTRMALGLIRQALDDTPILQSTKVNPGNLPAVPGTVPPSNLDIGQEAIDAFNKARSLNRNWMNQVESTPALKAVVDGIEPDQFVNQYIIGNGKQSNFMSVAKLKNQLNEFPEAQQAIRMQMATYLKKAATGVASDEARVFSQSGYNKALNAIGDRKLALFFSPEELAQLKAIGKVAEAEMIQPKGSAVNNSNTGAVMLATLIEKLANNPITRKIPFGEAAVVKPGMEVANSLMARPITNVPNALVLPKPKQPPVFPLPLLMTPGLLTSE